MKIINFIVSAVALFATTTPQLVNAQRIVSRTGGVRGLSNSDETKQMMGKIMNTIANINPDVEAMDIVERMLSNDKTMESIAKLKDALNGSNMSEMINTVIEQNNNKHGRKLEIDQDAMVEFNGWLEEQMVILGLDNLGSTNWGLIGGFIGGFILLLLVIVLNGVGPFASAAMEDLGGRMLTKEQGRSDIMESMLEKVKDMLGSLDKDTDMNEVIESFMTTNNNKHGRHLQGLLCPQVELFVGMILNLIESIVVQAIDALANNLFVGMLILLIFAEALAL